MERKFKDGEVVAHKTDTALQMTVIGYTNDGTVKCRWKEKAGFESDKFLETELEKSVPSPGDFPFMSNPKPPNYFS